MGLSFLQLINGCCGALLKQRSVERTFVVVEHEDI
jgi:hypothetical protein